MPTKILFVTGTSGQDAANTLNHSLTVPAGVKRGDLLVLHAAKANVNGVINPPSGWSTYIASQENGTRSETAVFYKVATASDVAGSTVTFTLSNGISQICAWSLVAWRGFDRANPFVGNAVGLENSVGLTNHTVDASAISPTGNAGVSFFYCASSNAGSFTAAPPSGYTEDGQSISTSSTFGTETSHKIVGAGSVGSLTTTSTNTAFGNSTVVAVKEADTPVVLDTSYWDSGATATSWTVTTPSGVQSGDLLVACIMAANFNLGTITPPAGWTAGPSGTSGNTKLHTFWKFAGASEPASYTFTTQNASEGSTGCLRIAGADSTTPLDAGSGAYVALASGAANPMTIPDMTAAGTNRLYVVFVGSWFDTSDGNQWTGPSPMVEVFEGVGGDTPQGAFIQQLSASGAVGTRDMTKNATLRARAGIGLLIAPAATGPSLPTTGLLHPRGWKNVSPTTGQLFPRRVIT